MNTKTKLITAACAALSVAGLAPAANAATIGNSSPSAVTTCDAYVVYIGGSGYTVPAAGGVITSWTINRTSGAGYSALKLVGPGVFADKKINATSDYGYASTPGPHTFNTRITANPGDSLALWHSTDQQCIAATGSGVTRSQTTIGPPASPETAFDLFGSTIVNAHLVVSAVIEPDADGDGYGDQTQDGCPSQGATQGACVQPAKPCVVPALRGKTKSAASAALLKANCKLGKVSKKKIRKFTKTKKKNRVASQSIKAGTTKSAATVVDIKIYAKKK